MGAVQPLAQVVTNPNIHFVDANDKQNKRQYDMLIYTPKGKAKLYAVV